MPQYPHATPERYSVLKMERFKWLLILLLSILVSCCPELSIKHETVNAKIKKVSRYESFQIMSLEVQREAQLLLFFPRSLRVGEKFVNEGSFCVFHELPRDKTSSLIFDSLFHAASVFNNTGLFVYDAPNGNLPPKVRIGSAKKFENRGIMWFQIGSRGYGVPSYESEHERNAIPTYLTIKIVEDWLNTGEIILLGPERHAMLAKMSEVSPNLNGVRNQGVITLKNASVRIDGAVRGNGCILVLSKTFLVLKKPLLFCQEQIIYMRPGFHYSTIALEVDDKLPSFDIKIENFNPKSKIYFSRMVILSPASANGKFFFHTYVNPDLGVLRLTAFNLRDVEFDGTTFRVTRYKQPNFVPWCRTDMTSTKKHVLALRTTS